VQISFPFGLVKNGHHAYGSEENAEAQDMNGIIQHRPMRPVYAGKNDQQVKWSNPKQSSDYFDRHRHVGVHNQRLRPLDAFPAILFRVSNSPRPPTEHCPLRVFGCRRQALRTPVSFFKAVSFGLDVYKQES